MHPVKRRRLDPSNATLTKPFRSPLHLSPGMACKTSPTTGGQQGKDLLHNQESDAPESNTSPVPPLSPHLSSSPSQTETIPSPLVQRRRFIHSRGVSRYTQQQASDPDYVDLQKRHASLLLTLKEVSQDLEVTKQALKYAKTSDDLGITKLIEKWRSVVRELLEELYAVAIDRVNKMGGIAAWRERYEKTTDSTQGNRSWGFTVEQDYDEDDLTAEQKEQLDIAREEAEKEEEKYGLHKPTQPKVKEQNDSFTMAMLLKQLNIDFEVVEYDAMAQTWSD